MTEHPVDLDDVIARISPPDASASTLAGTPDEDRADGHLTGELARLASWWRIVSADRPLVPVDVPLAPGTVTDGVAAADRAVDAGATLLVPRVVARDDIASLTIIALLTRREASAVAHQPAGMSDRAWMTRVAEVRDAVARSAGLRGEPQRLAESLGASGIAPVVGVLLAAAARRTPALVDGTDELAAALIADRLCYRAKGWWLPGSDSPDPGRTAAADRIDLPHGLPLQLDDDAGMGARATLALLGLALDGGVAD